MTTRFVLLFMIFFSFTVDGIVLPRVDTIIAPENLTFEIGYEIYKLRVDIIRGKDYLEFYSSSLIRDKLPELPYNYLCIYLGNGLILDAHNNLSVSLMALLKTPLPETFTICEKRDKAFNPSRRWIKTKKSLIYEKNTPFYQEKDFITFNESRILISRKKSGRINEEIIIKKNQLFYSNYLLKSLGSFSLIKKDDKIIINGTYGCEMVKNGNAVIELCSGSKIFKEDNIIKIVDKDNLLLYSIIRTKEAFYCLNKENKGFAVYPGKDGIIVTKENETILYEIN